MKRIGIITIHRHINVGCCLQAYGLQKTINKLGFESEIIDYHFPNTFHRGSAVKTRIKKLLSKQVKRLLFGGAYNRSEKRFRDFIKNQFQLSARPYKTVHELKANPPMYDLYCVGSDQVWHPTGTNLDPTFYGDFVPAGKPLVSYASSFGVTKIPEQYEDFYKAHLKRFKLLGVRELAGVEIIEKLIGRKAQMVVDPTLLLNECEWAKKMPVNTLSEPYILCYGTPYPNVFIEQLALHIQKQTGFNVFYIFGLPWQRFDRRIKHLFDIGPFEFLSLIKNASMVLTTSFHATIFSVSFKTPFYSVYADEENGSRALNILKALHLEDRGIKVGNGFPSESLFDVGFDNAHAILDCLRADSYAYLNNMLSVCN